MIIQQGLFRNQDVKKDGQKKVDNISSICQHKKNPQIDHCLMKNPEIIFPS